MQYILGFLREISDGFLMQVIIKSVLAVIIGTAIGSERARHGRAAGMRTHILVCLGSTLTSMIGIYAQYFLGNNGDLLRLSAQVVSGVGFLGAGMIILKNNNVITGLTTAAGVWTTSVIGIAIGCGFYTGAIIVSVLYLIAIILLGKFEKSRMLSVVVYVEIDDMYKANAFVDEVKSMSKDNIVFHTLPPRSGFSGHLGIHLTIDTKKTFDIKKLLEIKNVVFVEVE